jgi:hypothetical protein
MSHRASFRRKVIYIALIALLLIPLYYVGQPASSGAIDASDAAAEDGETAQRSDLGPQGGGKLAQLRAQHRLSQASLGDIDPASEAMKLGTLGMRGVAANYLWRKAIHYRKVKAWDQLSAATNQIIKLQPNFVEVWEFQGHNLAYNISVEFDNYEHRYHWVKKGIEFSMSGTRYNRDEPVMLWNVGWFFGQKLGRADEQLQFRRLFRVDKDFHNSINSYPNIDVDEARDNFTNQPDNWLVGRLWMLDAQRASRRPNASLLGKSPVIFHSAPSMAYIDYALALESEGFLGDRAQRAWSQAEQYWREYGDMEIPSTWGVSMRLNEKEPALERAKEAARRLDEIAVGCREQLRQEKLAALTPAERETVGKTEAELKPEQYGPYNAMLGKMMFRHTDVAARAPANVRSRAYAWAAKAEDAEILAERISRYREIVNFEYWRTRCAAEKSDAAIAARQYMHDARQEARQVQYEPYIDKDGVQREGAKALYEKAWVEWRKVFDAYPELKEDIAMSDVKDYVARYARVLDEMKLEFPEDFPLKDLGESLLEPEFTGGSRGEGSSRPGSGPRIPVEPFSGSTPTSPP